MLIRDRLLARLAEMGDSPDHRALAAEVLGIRNAGPARAAQLVSQALVLEDRRDAWRSIGGRVCAGAPASAGVYVLRDDLGRPLYVGKSTDLQRRLKAHFSEPRWRRLKAEFVRATSAEWQEVGSELEALLREAELIERLAPVANRQIGLPSLRGRRIPAALVRDVVVVLPSVDVEAAELISARVDGGWMIQRVKRSGAGLVGPFARLWRFFHSPLRSAEAAGALAPLVFSWLAGRGAGATRLDPHEWPRASAMREALKRTLADRDLFAERLLMR
jgi:predicted GIY-YIG superfamily endonuclease